MSAAPSRQGSMKPSEAGEAGRENIKHDKEAGVQENLRGGRKGSSTETPRENKQKANALEGPADKLPRKPQRRSSSISDVSKKTHLGSELKGPAATAEDAYAQRVQFSLDRLSLWEQKEGKEGNQGRGNLESQSSGSSPPDFIVTITASWPGCQLLCSFIAADLGPKVALWSVESPNDPATFLVYDPKRKKLEEEKGTGEEPEAALGVTLTPASIKGVRGALLFGGRSHVGEIINDCLFYNPANRKWTKVKCQGEKPAARCFHAAAFSTKTETLYIFGGQGEDGTTLAGTCKLVNGKEWIEMENEDAPPPRTHHSLSVIEGPTTGENLLLFGGLVDGADTNDLWALPLGSKKPTWYSIREASGTPPAARHGHSATVAGPRCFIFGGIGRHWLGWDVPYFDMNAYDIEASSWFSISLLSPLADLPSHGLAVATGDPSTMLHVFAAGDKSWNEGAIYRLAAVCSTLDISFAAQGLRHAKVVSADNRKRKEDMQAAVDEVRALVREGENSCSFMSSKAEELAERWESLIRAIGDTHSDVLAKLEVAQQLEENATAVASEVMAREAAVTAKCEELQRQMEHFQLRLSEYDQPTEDTGDVPQPEAPEGDKQEGE
ncbi:Kelch motif family protein, related [Eimeria praecox]|uniref:Kelch motif family protein, related n=1 Tax=Eimeria praecox TaxID=51316 RepID=U6H1V6_9EIME|nr:Kelch motif family protein, related [Eimeria praecox]